MVATEARASETSPNFLQKIKSVLRKDRRKVDQAIQVDLPSDGEFRPIPDAAFKDGVARLIVSTEDRATRRRTSVSLFEPDKWVKGLPPTVIAVVNTQADSQEVGEYESDILGGYVDIKGVRDHSAPIHGVGYTVSERLYEVSRKPIAPKA